jgi:hypothetical protein
MAKQSDAWKALERKVAEVLGGKRISRGGDFSISTYDVELPSRPELRIDCKWTARTMWHHTRVKEIETKYCQLEGSVPVLCTRTKHSSEINVTIPLQYFAKLLGEDTGYVGQP